MGIEDIITLAKKQGVDTISITDHDCMAGNIRAQVIDDRHGVTVIPGVEISATDSDTGDEIHILCYLSDSPDRLEGLCHRNLLARKKAAQYMMLKIAQKYPITPDLVLKCAQGSTNVYTVHIMAALLESGMATSICGELYDSLFGIGNGTRSFLVKPKFESPESVIDAIHDAGGIAVLSHPGAYSSPEIIERLVAHGLDGIEAWCPQHSEQQAESFAAYAKKHKILATGGSDFHGRFNLECVTLGTHTTPDKQLSELQSYKAKMRRKQKQEAAAD